MALPIPINLHPEGDLETEVRKLRRDLDELKDKLRPGSTFVQNLIGKLVLSETFTLQAGITVRGPFDYSPDKELAVYFLSAKVLVHEEYVEYSGATAVAGSGLFAAVQRLYRQGPPNDRLESFVSWFNNTAQPREVTVKVWRLLGFS